MERFELVQKAYSELLASGDIKPVTDERKIEEQKAFLTRRAAYYLNQADSSFGLLSKTSGNNVMGLSVDIVIKRDGTFYDIATDDGSQAKPVDAGAQNDPSLVSRWVQPTRELAGLDGTGNGGNEPPNDDVMKALAEIKANQTIIVNGLASLVQENQLQSAILNQMAKTLQTILDKPSPELPPITFPEYEGRTIFGNVVLRPRK